MADKIFVLSSRPASLKKLFDISVDKALSTNSPFERREANTFKEYFIDIWKELELHEQ